jgi:5-methylthioadenosine/S-adenosylhomocysteine deaminase
MKAITTALLTLRTIGRIRGSDLAESPFSGAKSDREILIRGGRVYDHDGDIDDPSVHDILVRGSRIVSVTAPDEDSELKQEVVSRAAISDEARVIEARGKLVIPGFVNSHYHSYDVLAKGLLEDMPFDVWALHSQPAYFGPRTRAELRIRTLLGALECIRNGITTLQDMNSLVPQDEETLDVILEAYAEIGIRVVFSIAVRDVAALDIAPFLPPDVPEAAMAIIRGASKDPREEIAFVERQIKRLTPLRPNITWGLSPSGPQRSSRALLEGINDLAQRYGLPIFTHVYETKAQTAKARAIYGEHGGSMIRYLADIGLLTPRTTIAHGVWLTRDEIEIMAEHRAGVAHNPISNLKLKSGVAPMHAAMQAGVRVALGCDNCSCGDCQNMFQAMKMFCLLAAVTDPNPTGVRSADAIKAATLGGAQAMNLEEEIGAVRAGMKADLVVIDLSDIAWQPLNSVARQLVFSEVGRGVETTIVDGEVVMFERRVTTIDEASLRDELASLMPMFRRDFANVAEANREAIPYLLAANERLKSHDVGINRFVAL